MEDILRRTNAAKGRKLESLSLLLPWLRQKLSHKTQNVNFFRQTLEHYQSRQQPFTFPLLLPHCRHHGDYFNVTMSHSNIISSAGDYTDSWASSHSSSCQWVSGNTTGFVLSRERVYTREFDGVCEFNSICKRV
ncbi:hypothetical protein ATANTOWER_005645 [Ataeniobius toweri]|uniref:Uncharacterized protein n=1 Tax=Ataeniobius toweri TaxID=208326 RepID=A0ABU7A5H5_9TELE|nr:hypothetical protein [Ataeniobius toweri]